MGSGMFQVAAPSLWDKSPGDKLRRRVNGVIKNLASVGGVMEEDDGRQTTDGRGNPVSHEATPGQARRTRDEREYRIANSPRANLRHRIRNNEVRGGGVLTWGGAYDKIQMLGGIANSGESSSDG